ncbi:MAG TPA: hypothetical protein VGH00_00120 [Chthoniobacterales bacterium]
MRQDPDLTAVRSRQDSGQLIALKRAMDEFGYLAVILSIILGLSVTQLLQGLSNLINARERVRIYWPAIGWALLLLVIDIQAWWSMFGYRARHSWTFIQFGILLLETILLYLLAALALPSTVGDEIVDLRANYFRHSRWFFGTFLGALMVSLLKNVIMSGAIQGPFDLSFHLFWLVGTVFAAVTRNDRFHKVFVCVAGLSFIIYIGALFAELR